MTKQEDLTAYLFGGQPHLLSSILAQWMEESPRFTAFVETYRDKIRKKIRVTPEPESILDLRSELEVAYRLLNDRRLAVTYEPYASAKGRGPDYAVTYRANLVFNVEVARLRVEESVPGENLLQRNSQRLIRVILNKLGQMHPGMPNLLVIQSQEELLQSIDLDGLMQAVKIRVEGKDPAFFASTRYSSPGDFYKDFLNLSGILLWSSTLESVTHRVWTNKQSQHNLPEAVLRLIGSLFEI